MEQSIVNVLAKSTPALRARYLQRVRSVPGPEARRLEAEIRVLVERDSQSVAA